MTPTAKSKSAAPVRAWVVHSTALHRAAVVAVKICGGIARAAAVAAIAAVKGVGVRGCKVRVRALALERRYRRAHRRMTASPPVGAMMMMVVVIVGHHVRQRHRPVRDWVMVVVAAPTATTTKGTPRIP